MRTQTFFQSLDVCINVQKCTKGLHKHTYEPFNFNSVEFDFVCSPYLTILTLFIVHIVPVLRKTILN